VISVDDVGIYFCYDSMSGSDSSESVLVNGFWNGNDLVNDFDYIGFVSESVIASENEPCRQLLRD
jgi:hypothetical protein